MVSGGRDLRCAGAPPRWLHNVRVDVSRTSRCTFFTWWMNNVRVDLSRRSRCTLCATGSLPSPAAFDVRPALGAQRAAVLLLVIRAVVAGADRLPPLAVIAIPVDRALQPVGEADLGLPAHVRARLLRSERVTAIVAGAVGDVGDQRLVGAGVLDDLPHDLEVGRLVRPADVVDLARRAALEPRA